MKRSFLALCALVVTGATYHLITVDDRRDPCEVQQLESIPAPEGSISSTYANAIILAELGISASASVSQQAIPETCDNE